MRLSSLASARPAYYDRNATSGSIAYQGTSIAPHADTQRATVTLASGKRAFLEATSLIYIRATAATAATFVYASASLIPSGGTGVGYLLVPQINNTVGTVSNISLGGSLTIGAGDVLSLYTSDTSTGGTYNYYLAIKYTQFDA